VDPQSAGYIRFCVWSGVDPNCGCSVTTRLYKCQACDVIWANYEHRQKGKSETGATWTVRHGSPSHLRGSERSHEHV
jgi:hypothetical protein